MRGVDGRLEVVPGQASAGMRPQARSAGEDAARAVGEEGLVAPGQDGPLLRLHLGDLTSAVVGGVGAVVLAGQDEVPATRSPRFACQPSADSTSVRGQKVGVVGEARIGTGGAPETIRHVASFASWLLQACHLLRRPSAPRPHYPRAPSFSRLTRRDSLVVVASTPTVRRNSTLPGIQD